MTDETDVEKTPYRVHVILKMPIALDVQYLDELNSFRFVVFAENELAATQKAQEIARGYCDLLKANGCGIGPPVVEKMTITIGLGSTKRLNLRPAYGACMESSY